MKSSDFRKCYASLDEPTLVTVNGHTIGKWIPMTDSKGTEWTESSGPTEVTRPVPKMSQAQRDAILRRINKTGNER